ncbi:MULTISPECIES: polysaccharide pyruvyl transferase family protein [Aeromicrobium]|uniref:polysaccharide pyruvyl transferase family protein n=1 Tax=Aeromicrobium TaxID=2040 RepID=UPI0025810693|nr:MULTISPECIES: polysaccharide pyruvyl transferase family protein [Aeromicrobium]
MARILLKVHHAALDPADATSVLERNLIGNNVGNLAFSFASERLLTHPGDDVTAAPTGPWFADPARVNREFDHVVFPLANHFRASNLKALNRQAAAIEQLTTRFTVLGVGAQADLDGNAPRDEREAVEAATRRFVRAVLERGPSIGVRGDFTKEYLLDLGFDDAEVDVIGCPSMFLHGPELPLRLPGSVGDDDPIAITISPYVREMGPILQQGLRRHRRLTYIGQDIHTLRLLLRGTPLSGDDARLPLSPEHPVFAPGRTVFPLNIPAWQEFLRGQRFTYGTRIHGTIVSLISGTPAVLLAHDSRTLELARYHRIPFVRLDQHDPAGISVPELFARADWPALVDGHRERWDTYAAFLERHGLRHGFGPDGGTERFDASVAAVATDPGYPPVVRSDAGPVSPARRLARAVRRRLP